MIIKSITRSSRFPTARLDFSSLEAKLDNSLYETSVEFSSNVEVISTKRRSSQNIGAKTTRQSFCWESAVSPKVPDKIRLNEQTSLKNTRYNRGHPIHSARCVSSKNGSLWNCVNSHENYVVLSNSLNSENAKILQNKAKFAFNASLPVSLNGSEKTADTEKSPRNYIDTKTKITVERKNKPYMTGSQCVQSSLPPNLIKETKKDSYRRGLRNLSTCERITFSSDSPKVYNDLQQNSHTEPFRKKSSQQENSDLFFIRGTVSKEKQSKFENKLQQVKSVYPYISDPSLLSKFGLGFTCKKGLKSETQNQDDFCIYRSKDWGLYGVFDGHGRSGHIVANFVQCILPQLIFDHPEFQINTKRVLREAFFKINAMLERHASSSEALDCTLSGTTATIVLHLFSLQKLFVAHVGDSKCILGRDQGSYVKVIHLTNDHKPEISREKARIQRFGGEVKKLEGDTSHRVFLKGRLIPGLAMSRAIGDFVGRTIGISCEPDIYEHDIDVKRDICFCLSSDGVWEFVNPSEALKLILSYYPAKAHEAATALAQEAWFRWIEEEGNIVDDITTEIIFLNSEFSKYSST